MQKRKYRDTKTRLGDDIFIYLLKKSLLAFLLLLGAQAFFYLYNLRIFHVESAAEWVSILWGNIRFGLVTIGIVLLPYYIANLLPFPFRWNRHYRRSVNILLYFIPLLVVFITDLCDGAYFQFTYRRLSADIFCYLGIGGDMGTLIPHFVVDYWPVTVCGVVFVLLCWINSSCRLSTRKKFRNYVASDIVGSVLAVVCLFFFVQVFILRTNKWCDSTRYSQAKNSAMVTNSVYNIIRTLDGASVPEVNYMDSAEAVKLFDPQFVVDSASIASWGIDDVSNGWYANAGCVYQADTTRLFPGNLLHATKGHSNIVIIVLESFSQEYMGCYNKAAKTSYTPFLDSLAQHSVVYQGRANGKKSIEGIPAIFASMPTLMFCPLSMSAYADNDMHALPAILAENGYHTAFFHGSYNGVMSFDKLCQQLGFQEYYGKNEYMADRLAQSSDYDGAWGIYDEHFLQFFSRRLSTFQEPFMAGVFTLSSHHPYTMQPGHEDDFAEGPHPLCRVVSYTDNALRKFFDAARHTNWYRNTTFVITADHSGQGLTREYNDYDGWYRIPMLIYRPFYEEQLAQQFGADWSCHQVSPRIMQQTDIMPTILDYLGIPCRTVCFGTSVFRNPDGWQVVFGNGYYQLETKDGVTICGQQKEEIHGQSHVPLLKSVVQQYNHRFNANQLK